MEFDARYLRQIALAGFGEPGQARLAEGRVLLVGVGGLGSPAAMYLAAAGVGTLGLVDFDAVDETNLHRQIIYDTPDVGRPKLAAAAERLRAINPHTTLELHEGPLDATNARDLIERYMVVIDGTDNFATRYLVNDASVMTRTPNVYGSIHRFEGQASVFAAADGPCYRCLHPDPPPAGLIPSCAEAGVLGVLPGIIGTVQATEAIKLLTGLGEPLVGRLLLYDALRMRFREIALPRDPDCPVCGDHPTIRDLVAYERMCAADGASADLSADQFIQRHDAHATTSSDTPRRPDAIARVPFERQRLNAAADDAAAARAHTALRKIGAGKLPDAAPAAKAYGGAVANRIHKLELDRLAPFRPRDVHREESSMGMRTGSPFSPLRLCARFHARDKPAPQHRADPRIQQENAATYGTARVKETLTRASLWRLR